METPGKSQPRRIGRYGIFGEIASGGMATVYFGRLMGAVGFSRSVAIKQLHAQYARSPEFVAQFLDEARLTARIRHPNVVSVLDVVAREGELFVVMEYVQGEPLSRLARLWQEPPPIAVISSIVVQVLLGLHAAHEATGENGLPLAIVHRDVSPQNILVGVDGVAHLLDFGVAKAASRLHTTENGLIKGKLAYMSPEQLHNEPFDRRVDLFATGVVLWELLTGQRLFARGDPGATVSAVLSGGVKRPSELRPEISPALDAVVLKALAPEAKDRFATAREMALALEQAAEPASVLRTGAWVESVAKDSLEARAERLRQVEEGSSPGMVLDPASLQRSLASSGSVAPPARAADSATFDAPPGDRSRRRTRVALWSGVGLACVLLAATIVALSKRSPPPESPRVSAATQNLESPVLSDSAPKPAAAVEPTPVLALSQIPSEAPAPSASGRPRAVVSSPKAPAKVSRRASACTPPYVLDAQGRKRFKPECF